MTDDPELVASEESSRDPDDKGSETFGGFDPYENFSIPEKYGDVRCPLCQGRGRLATDRSSAYRGPPALQLCKCVLLRSVIANLERGWSGLAKARRIPKSDLTSRIEQDLRIVADDVWFSAHLRHIALRQPPMWEFRVVSDVELMQAWLATAAARGMEIFDADVRDELDKRSLRYMTLTDIATSARLLIVRLGVKAAPNKEMPNVLLEVLQIRKHEGLPTWLWESPNFPLSVGHLCWSEFVDFAIVDWERVTGTEQDLDRVPDPKPRRVVPSTSSPAPVGVTRTPAPVERPESGGYDAESALGRASAMPAKKKSYKKGSFR